MYVIALPHDYLFRQIVTKPRKRSQKDDEEKGSKGRKKRPHSGSQPAAKRPKLRPGDDGYDPYDFTSDDEEESPDLVSKSHDQEVTMETEQSSGRVELGDEK